VRVKLDENLPAALADLLRSARHDVRSVLQERLGGRPDPDVYLAAIREGRLLVTFDTDFSNIRTYPPGRHEGIVVFRVRDQRWKSLGPVVRRMLQERVLENLSKRLAILDETRTRFRGPEQ